MPRRCRTPEFGSGLDGVLRRARQPPGRHPQRRRQSGLESGHRPGCRRPIRAQDWRQGGLQGGDAGATGLDAPPDAPLFAVVSRLTDQKGRDLLLAALPALLRRGPDDPAGHRRRHWRALRAARRRIRDRSGCTGLRRSAGAPDGGGADVILVPSRFEPCGLTQMYGLALRQPAAGAACRRAGRHGGRRGARAPRRRRATGFVFEGFDSAPYGAALRRAFALQARDAEWRRVQRAAMHRVFDWDGAAAHYVALYRSLLPSGREHAAA